MTVLVLARGALEGSDRPKNAICLKFPKPGRSGEAEVGSSVDRRSIHKPFW
jgi:hypothetical protein